MGYIGNQPAEKFSSFSKQTFSPDGSSTSFTLDYAVSGENELALFVNNVRQEPGSGKAYTASGTTLTMSEAPGSSDTMYGIFIGKAVQTVTPNLNPITLDRENNFVGIGTASPSAELDIQADVPSIMLTDTDGTNQIGLVYANAGNLFLQSQNNTTNGKITLRRYDGSTLDTTITMDSGGGLLLGTTSAGSAIKGDLVVNGNIYLGGTGSANALDDYEEGTWTPEYTGDSGSFSSVTYDSFRAGRYTKIGRMVFAYGFIRTDAISLGTLSGTLKVTGLPFTALSTGQPYKFMVALGTRHNFNGAIEIVGSAVNDNSTEFFLTKDYNTGSSVQVTDLGTGTNQNHLQFTAIYETA